MFTAGLLLAGTAGKMAVFVVGRGTQGIGVGLASIAVLQRVALACTAGLRPRALAVISAAYALPGLAGPVTAPAGWRWMSSAWSRSC
ncbi:hypothetical protein [Streptomyces sp. NPDC048644]|uniref:hypothetical protein n=1 Tax=Streptomyces sp. NPDC048644 TaxID=3365582 RepID=UPI00371CFDF2